MLWSCVLAIVAVASLASAQLGAPAEGGVPAGVRGFLEPRLAASGIRLARLERDVKELHSRIEDAKKVDPQGFIDDLEERIDHVEAKTDHCDSTKEVRCGHDTLECVNTLLLCDGHEDCHNGWDENAKTCSAGPAKSGNTFVGTAHWTSCLNRDDHPVKIVITGTYKAKFFGARLGVRGLVSADFVDDEHEHREFEVKGFYTYGKKRLTLFPKNEQAAREHLGVVCDFVHGNDRTAECIFTHEGSLLTCATLHINLQD